MAHRLPSLYIIRVTDREAPKIHQVKMEKEKRNDNSRGNVAPKEEYMGRMCVPSPLVPRQINRKTRAIFEEEEEEAKNSVLI